MVEGISAQSRCADAGASGKITHLTMEVHGMVMEIERSLLVAHKFLFAFSGPPPLGGSGEKTLPEVVERTLCQENTLLPTRGGCQCSTVYITVVETVCVCVRV